MAITLQALNFTLAYDIEIMNPVKHDLPRLGSTVTDCNTDPDGIFFPADRLSIA